MDFVYGPDQQRWYTELLSGDTITRSTVYVGNYEKITEDGKKVAMLPIVKKTALCTLISVFMITFAVD